MGGTGKDFGARGWLNAPIMIGDVTVQPGDLVAGDTEGVVVVPRAVVADTVEASASREAMEAKIMDQLREGASTLDLYGWNK
jgi:4-hydroxy-4-methyl-2-oxoglutarate aldolase